MVGDENYIPNQELLTFWQINRSELMLLWKWNFVVCGFYTYEQCL